MLSDSLLDELSSFAVELAEIARREVMPFWRKRGLPVQSKLEPARPTAESPVTAADRNAEAAMREKIGQRYPSHGILGEEMGAEKADAEFCWVLDPIDGTKSFITGKPLFGILIGLCHKGTPIIGVIDQPILNERWVGVCTPSRKQTLLNGSPVTADATVTDLSEALLYATTPHMFAVGEETAAFDRLKTKVKQPMYGCDCYAYALVASGFGAHLVCEADLGIYDYAALVPVLLGANASVSDWNGGPLSINTHSTSKGRVLASSNATLHAAALAALAMPPGVKPGFVVKPHLQVLAPYLPPLDGRSATKHLLLDFNERTVPPPAHVTDAIITHIQSGTTQCYPAYGDINERIAEYAGVKPSQCMFTNGSDQGIDLIIRACCPDGSEAIIPAPTFAMYEQAALTENLKILRPWFTREDGFPTAAVLSTISPRTTLIVLSNPNNPTGTPISKADMLSIVKAAPHAAVLVDECYFEFMGEDSTMVGEVSAYPNLFVTRTFSKTWGMPSLRIGYLISHEENIKALCSVRGPYDVNQLAIVALRAALANKDYVFDFVNEHNNQSKPKFEEFLSQKGIVFWPSAANYIFCYFDDPVGLEKRLRERDILVRPKKDAEGTLGLRVSLGTLDQTHRLIGALEELLASPPAKKLKT